MNAVVLTAFAGFALAQVAFEIFGSFAGLPFAIAFRNAALSEKLLIAPIVAGLAGVPLTMVCVRFLFVFRLGSVPWWAWFYWECIPLWNIFLTIRACKGQLNDAYLPRGAARAHLRGEVVEAACLILVPAVMFAQSL